MNNVCLCVGKYAKEPFYIKFSEINVYSVEELCYYFMENIQTLDQDLMTLDLVDWIRTECGLPQIAEELEPFVRKHGSMAVFVTTLFEKTKIYNEAIIKNAERILKEQAMLTPFECWDRKAKQEYQAGRFHQAQQIYEKLLLEVSKEDAQTRARLYYNLASIYAMNFDYEEAAAYYWESYEILQSAKTRLAYLTAVKKSMTDFDYGVFKREHEQWEADFEQVAYLCEQAEQAWENAKVRDTIEQMKQWKEAGQIAAYYDKRDELILHLKKDYRRQTM